MRTIACDICGKVLNFNVHYVRADFNDVIIKNDEAASPYNLHLDLCVDCMAELDGWIRARRDGRDA